MKKIGIFLLCGFLIISCNVKKENTENGNLLENLLDNDLFYQLANRVFAFTSPIGINIKTGDLYNTFLGDLTVNNKTSIIEIDIFENNYLNYKYVYNDGFLTEDYSVYDDGVKDNTYYLEYDDKNRLIKRTIWEYIYHYNDNEYKTEYKRDVYYENKYYLTETISNINSGYKLTIEDYNGSKWGSDFVFNDDLLIQVVNYSAIDGKPYMWNNLEYIDRSLQKITILHGNNIYILANVVRRNGDIILEIERESHDPDIIWRSNYKFKNHDDFGNWTIREKYVDNNLEETIRRVIKYKEDVQHEIE